MDKVETNNKKKKVTVLILVAVLSIAGAAGLYFYPLYASRLAAQPVEYKYFTLEKVIVMLRAQEGGALSHYLALDLVFKTTPEQEKKSKEYSPLYRSIAVKALSAHTADAVRLMTVEQLTADLNRAFDEGFSQENLAKPFAEVMIGKLLIE